tara:strand:+ start:21964 stop:22371 length:408 start_codon:yes stop_codon:yes gene_type:complete
MAFSLQVRKYTANYRRRANAVFKQSVQDVAQHASVPVAQGGRMRVKTGFLRNSIRGAIGSLPSGPSQRGGVSNNNAVEDVTLVIAGAEIGDTVYVGWTANYARPREYRDGFLASAAQKWPDFVDKNAARARREIK